MARISATPAPGSMANKVPDTNAERTSLLRDCKFEKLETDLVPFCSFMDRMSRAINDSMVDHLTLVKLTCENDHPDQSYGFVFDKTIVDVSDAAKILELFFLALSTYISVELSPDQPVSVDDLLPFADLTQSADCETLTCALLLGVEKESELPPESSTIIYIEDNQLKMVEKLGVKGHCYLYLSEEIESVIDDHDVLISPIMAMSIIEERFSALRDGAAYSKTLVTDDFQAKLNETIDEYKKRAKLEFHPGMEGVVLDVVHPGRYPYVHWYTPVDPPEKASLFKNEPCTKFGRLYDQTIYQWLPANFYVHPDGKVDINSYISHLPKTEENTGIYNIIKELFERQLKLLEPVYKYVHYVKTTDAIVPHDPVCGDYEVYDFDNKSIVAYPEEAAKRATLYGRNLQVITKIADYEFVAGQEFEGVWHYEGSGPENIVMTAIYYPQRDEELEGGELVYKRTFSKIEMKNHIDHDGGQTRTEFVQQALENGQAPLGRMPTDEGLALAWPNTHAHKLTKMKAGPTKAKQTRRMVVFFIVDPEEYIISTSEVPYQSTVDEEKLKEHMLKLMEERRFQKGTMNPRHIELCEH